MRIEFCAKHIEDVGYVPTWPVAEPKILVDLVNFSPATSRGFSLPLPLPLTTPHWLRPSRGQTCGETIRGDADETALEDEIKSRGRRTICHCRIALALIICAPSYTNCYEAEQAKSAANEKAQPNPIPKRSGVSIFFACQGEFIDHNDKVITAIFTVVLALSTIFLWLATSNIVSSTEEANRKQLERAREVERAYFTERRRDATETTVGEHGAIVVIQERDDCPCRHSNECCDDRPPIWPR